MQIKQLIFQTAKKTKLPILEIELILAYTLKKSTPLETSAKKRDSFQTGSREFIIAHPEHELTPKQISNFQFLISKRLKGIPIAYITGHKEFYGLNFLVNQDVMIPRPETEVMVEEALNRITRNAQCVTHNAKTPHLPPLQGGHTIIVDVGTGSGCIIITLAKLLNRESARPPRKPACWRSGRGIRNYKFVATDISKKALAVARKNAKLHRVEKKIKFLRGNLLKPIFKNPNFKFQISNFIILANLPYLTPSQIKKSPTIKYEPKLALNGGREGLKYLEKLLKQINYLITNYQLPITCLCEFDPRQTTSLKKLINKYLPTATYEIKKDLCGLNRLAVIKI